MFADGVIEVTETWEVTSATRHEFTTCWREMTYFLLANMKIGYKNSVLATEKNLLPDQGPPKSSQLIDAEDLEATCPIGNLIDFSIPIDVPKKSCEAEETSID